MGYTRLYLSQHCWDHPGSGVLVVRGHCISLRSPRHSVHTNRDIDSHVVTLATTYARSVWRAQEQAGGRVITVV
jgi:hypothetical protein